MFKSKRCFYLRLFQIALLSSSFLTCFSLANAKSANVSRSDILSLRNLFIEKTFKWSSEYVDSKKANVLHVLKKSNVSSECSASIIGVLESFKDLDKWAVEMIDSWGKLPMSGLLKGTNSDLGAFDECIDVEPNKIISKAQYCTVIFKPYLVQRPKFHSLLDALEVFEINSTSPGKVHHSLLSTLHFYFYFPLRLGICMPSKCSVQEVNKLAIAAGVELFLQGHVEQCEIKETSLRLDIFQVIAILVLLIVTVLTVTGTAVDHLFEENDNRKSKFSWALRACKYLVKFSVTRNVKNIVNTETAQDDLRCVHGIRVLMMLWVIFGHTILWTNHTAFGRIHNIIDVLTSFWWTPVFNTFLSVDPFFLISGLLTTYVTMKATQGKLQNFNLLAFLLARYVRLTPQYIIIILMTTLLPLLGSGPMWKETIEMQAQRCRDNWWTNILYISNWVHNDTPCLLQTWFVSCDFQFHLMALLVIYPLLIRPVYGMISNILLIGMSSAIVAWKTYYYSYPPTAINIQPQVEERYDFMMDIYVKPWTHAGSFCIGLALGYCLAQHKVTKLKKGFVVGGWLIFVLVLFCILFAPYPWNNGVAYTVWEAVLYAATSRTLFAAAIAWVILMSTAYQGGFVDSVLSWKGFIPLSRCTYMVYLTHMWFVWLYIGGKRQILDTSVSQGLYMYVNNISVAFGIGFILTAFLESPVLAMYKDLQKVLTRSYRSRSNARFHQVNRLDSNYNSCLAEAELNHFIHKNVK